MNDHRNGASDPLLQPMSLKPGMTCRNRVAMAAMTQYSAAEDGSVGETELAHVARRSSRPGVVFTACVATSPGGKAYDGEPAAHYDRFLPGLTACADTIKREGAKAILQLHHGGGICPPRWCRTATSSRRAECPRPAAARRPLANCPTPVAR